MDAQKKRDLFNELSKSEKSGDFDKAHRICNKILNSDPNNITAKLCKIVCKIFLNQYDEALKEITKPKLAEHENYLSFKNDLMFQKAYCEYSLNKIDECLKTLESLSDNDNRTAELKAQALYRKELYSDSYLTYVHLIKNTHDEFEDERAANLSATLACLNIEGNAPLVDLIHPENTFEQLYNGACIELGKKKFDQALEKLNNAEVACKKMLEEDESWTEEEIEAELNPIKAQKAYTYQKIGNDKMASEIYNQVLKQNKVDHTIAALINNNLVAINQDQNIFDSKKRMKNAITEMEKAKLLTFQKKTLLVNNCILNIQTNQRKSSETDIELLKKNYSVKYKAELLVLEAALLCDKKKYDEAINLIEDFIRNNDLSENCVLDLNLIIVQIYLVNKNVNGAVTVLKNIKCLPKKLGLVSLLVALELDLKNIDGAIKILQDTIALNKKDPICQKENLNILYLEAINLYLENNKFKDAAEILEIIRSSDSSNIKILIKLLNAYSKFDVEKAKLVAQDLPSLDDLISDVDIELYESSNWSAGAKYVKKILEETSGKKVTKKQTKSVVKKHKRKTKYPKNYDPNVKPDPERWLPKWSRKNYRKKKNDRKFNVGKGTQGSIGNAEPIDTTTKQSPRSVGNSPMINLSRQQRIQKKKRGGKR